MNVGDFDYELPRELIAQSPAPERDASRLLVLNRADEAMTHSCFRELPRYLQAGDVLVINDTKVIPARLTGRRKTGGRVKLLLVRPLEGHRWASLIDTPRRLKPDEEIHFDTGARCRILGKESSGKWCVEFSEDPHSLMKALGEAPLPPYIRRDGRATPEDLERYQTIYARAEGSIAAPTAGLHFTPRLLTALQERGVRIATITLHVGLGTFKPIQTECVEDHTMEEEFFEIPRETADTIRTARENRQRILAVGTTACRTLESSDGLTRLSGSTGLFITPGFRFRIVDAMITNFHLPRGTPLMLVCALAGREQIMNAYQEAIRERYRFYSYGDAMLIV